MLPLVCFLKAKVFLKAKKNKIKGGAMRRSSKKNNLTKTTLLQDFSLNKKQLLLTPTSPPLPCQLTPQPTTNPNHSTPTPTPTTPPLTPKAPHQTPPTPLPPTALHAPQGRRRVGARRGKKLLREPHQLQRAAVAQAGLLRSVVFGTVAERWGAREKAGECRGGWKKSF